MAMKSLWPCYQGEEEKVTWIDIGRYLMTLIWADRADPELF